MVALHVIPHIACRNFYIADFAFLGQILVPFSPWCPFSTPLTDDLVPGQHTAPDLTATVVAPFWLVAAHLEI